MRRLIASTLCAALVAAAPAAAADPAPAPGFSHLNSPRLACRTEDATSCVMLAPGYFLDEAAWAVREAELRRLQDAETRLKAENQSLRGTLAGWQPGWFVITTALVVGIAVGAYATYKL